MHVKSRRHDPFRSKCRDMERSILAAKRGGKVQARIGKRAANSSERVRMQALLRTMTKELNDSRCDEVPCSCTICRGFHEVVAPTIWIVQFHLQGKYLREWIESVQSERRRADHVRPLIRWFVMNIRCKDETAVNRFADLAFSRSLSGRHARVHALWFFGHWGEDHNRPKFFAGWDELTKPDFWGRNGWTMTFAPPRAKSQVIEIVDDQND